MFLVDKINKYKQESGVTYEQIAKAIGADPIKFRCFMFGKGKLTKSQLIMLDLIINAKLEEKDIEKEVETIEEN